MLDIAQQMHFESAMDTNEVNCLYWENSELLARAFMP